MKTILAIAAALTVATLAPAAFAQEEGPATSVVSYADLDLATPAGRAALERRVERAVEHVCPARPLPTELDKRADYVACHRAALSGARQQLAEIYSGRRLAQAAVRIAGN